MSVDFYASRAPADPADLAGWVLGKEKLNVTATNAMQFLQLLGYPVDPAECCGEAEPAEFTARIGVARIEGLTAAYERWGEWHRPGYFESGLDQLEKVAREAMTIGGEVTWA